MNLAVLHVFDTAAAASPLFLAASASKLAMADQRKSTKDGTETELL